MSEFNEFKSRLKSLNFLIECWHKSWKIEHTFKWNQPYLSRGLNLSHGSNSLNSASGHLNLSGSPLILKCLIFLGFQYKQSQVDILIKWLYLLNQSVSVKPKYFKKLMLWHSPKGFFPNENFPRVFSQVGTSQMCNFSSANFPNLS